METGAKKKENRQKTEGTKAPSKAQMRAEQEKVIRELTRADKERGNNKWQMLASEGEGSGKTGTGTDTEDDVEKPPTPTPRTADDLG